MLIEIRSGGKTGSTALESDGYISSYPYTDDAYNLGTVRYTHAAGIDAPVTVIRDGLIGQSGAVTVSPHANWQGDFEIGTLMSGALTTTCSGENNCPLIRWPGQNTTADGEPIPGAPARWMGNLLSNKTDQSGLQYMRNRYYDPKTGRFTQEDPIGLAGGINLYGFAGGDPVNFSDPFGLTAEQDTSKVKRGENPSQCLALGASIAINGFLDASTIVGLGAGIRTLGTVVRGGATVLGAYMGATASTRTLNLATAGAFTSGRVNAAAAQGMMEMSSGLGIAAVSGGRAVELSALEGMAVGADPFSSLRELGKDLVLPGRATVRAIGNYRTECSRR